MTTRRFVNFFDDMTMTTARSDLYSFNLAALITVSGKNYGFYGVLGFTPKFGEVPRLLQVRCSRFCILLQVSHTTIVITAQPSGLGALVKNNRRRKHGSIKLDIDIYTRILKQSQNRYLSNG